MFANSNASDERSRRHEGADQKLLRAVLEIVEINRGRLIPGRPRRLLKPFSSDHGAPLCRASSGSASRRGSRRLNTTRRTGSSARSLRAGGTGSWSRPAAGSRVREVAGTYNLHDYVEQKRYVAYAIESKVREALGMAPTAMPPRPLA